MSLRDLKRLLDTTSGRPMPVGVQRKDGWTVYHTADNWHVDGWPPFSRGSVEPLFYYAAKEAKLPTDSYHFYRLQRPFGLHTDTAATLVVLINPDDEWEERKYAVTTILSGEDALREAERRAGRLYFGKGGMFDAPERISAARAREIVKLDEEYANTYQLWIPAGPAGLAALEKRKYGRGGR